MGLHSRITLGPIVTTDTHIAGGAIILKQEEALMTLTSRKAALKLANDIIAHANTFWTDNPYPVDSSIRESGYANQIARGE